MNKKNVIVFIKLSTPLEFVYGLSLCRRINIDYIIRDGGRMFYLVLSNCFSVHVCRNITKTKMRILSESALRSLTRPINLHVIV